jgi:hypothetical protein
VEYQTAPLDSQELLQLLYREGLVNQNGLTVQYSESLFLKVLAIRDLVKPHFEIHLPYLFFLIDQSTAGLRCPHPGLSLYQYRSPDYQL